MILRIPVPEDWTSQVVADGVLHQTSGVMLRALRIRELPAQPAEWMRRTALQGAPVGTAFTVKTQSELATAEGWPAMLLEVALRGPDREEMRLVVLYHFGDYAAGAVLRAEAASYPDRRDALLDLLGRASPDWGPQPTASLSRLFDGVELPAAPAAPGPSE